MVYGAAGTAGGGSGGNSIVKVGDGSKLWITAGGGGGGGPTSGLNGGAGGSGGTVGNAGSENFPGYAGIDGGPGQNGVQGNGFPANLYPNNPNGGGYGSVTVFDPLGNSTAGINVFVGGLSGTYNQTITGDGSFNLTSVGNPISATFVLKGGSGGGARGGYSGHNGAYVSLQLDSGQLATMKNYQWSVKSGGNGGNGI